MKWYAFYVRAGKEDIVCSYLINILNNHEDFNFKLFVPKRKLIEYRLQERISILKPLFPGYILLYTNSVLKIYNAIQARGWHSDLLFFLKTENGFQEIRLEEIHPIINLVNKEGIIDTSTIFLEQDKVIIKEGPLINYQGRIKKINKRKGRAKISLTFLNRVIDIDICITCLEKINEQDIKKMHFFI